MSQGVRQWPLSGTVMQFYVGGFESPDEDLRKLLRHIARWSEHHMPGHLSVEAVHVWPVSEMDPNEQPTTWGASALLVDR